MVASQQAICVEELRHLLLNSLLALGLDLALLPLLFRHFLKVSLVFNTILVHFLLKNPVELNRHLS